MKRGNISTDSTDSKRLKREETSEVLDAWHHYLATPSLHELRCTELCILSASKEPSKTLWEIEQIFQFIKGVWPPPHFQTQLGMCRVMLVILQYFDFEPSELDITLVVNAMLDILKNSSRSRNLMRDAHVGMLFTNLCEVLSCTRAEIDNHVLSVIDRAAKYLFDADRQIGEGLQNRLAEGICKLFGLLDTKSQKKVATKLVSHWICGQCRGSKGAVIVIETLRIYDEGSKLAPKLARKISEKIVREVWTLRRSEWVKEFRRKVVESANSSTTRMFIAAFIHALFSLSWKIKTDKFTVFLFESLETLFLPIEESFGDTVEFRKYFPRLRELVSQLASSDRLIDYYVPALYRLLNAQSFSTVVKAKDCVLTTVSWHTCVTVIPLALHHTLSTQDTRSLDSIYRALVCTHCHLPGMHKAQKLLFDLIMRTHLESPETPNLSILWQYVLRGSCNSADPVSNMASEVGTQMLNDKSMVETLKTFLTDQHKHRSSYFYTGALSSLVKQALSLRKSGDSDLRANIKVIVYHLAQLGNISAVARLVAIDATLAPILVAVEALNQVQEHMHTQGTTVTPWLFILESVIRQSPETTLLHLDEQTLFKNLFKWLKTCDLSFIGTLTQMLASMAKRNPPLLSALHLLVARILELADSVSEVERISLILAGAVNWQLTTDLKAGLVETLLCYDYECRSMAVRKVIGTAIATMCHGCPDLIMTEDIRAYLVRKDQEDSKVCIWIAFCLGVKQIKGCRRNTEFIKWQTHKAAAVAYDCEDIISLYLLRLNIHMCSTVVGVPQIIALCFSSNTELTHIAWTTCRMLCLRWPTQVAHAFHEGIRMVKASHLKSWSRLVLLWNELEKRISHEPTRKKLAVGLTELIDKSGTHLEFSVFVINGINRILAYSQKNLNRFRAPLEQLHLGLRIVSDANAVKQLCYDTILRKVDIQKSNSALDE